MTPNERADGRSGESASIETIIKSEPVDISLLFGASTSPEPHENGKSTRNHSETAEKSSSKPTWFPSRSSRSVVWEHIRECDEAHRVICNYCTAEFQIKGGTSAVLRHLKTNHPKMIDYDPENPPPPKRKKKNGDDITIISDDTKEYMDNLLKQFLPDAEAIDSSAHSRADSEIDEVIRNLKQNESVDDPPVEHQDEMDDPDQDIRKMLGLLDTQPSVIEAIEVNSSSIRGERDESPKIRAEPQTRPILAQHLLRSTNSPTPVGRSASHSPLPHPNGKRKHAADDRFSEKPKFARRVPTTSSAPDLPPNLHNGPHPPLQVFRVTHADVDLETKMLYNQSLQASIMREHTVTRYYALKSKKLEMEMRKLEIECGLKMMNWPAQKGSDAPGSPN